MCILFRPLQASNKLRAKADRMTRARDAAEAQLSSQRESFARQLDALKEHYERECAALLMIDNVSAAAHAMVLPPVAPPPVPDAGYGSAPTRVRSVSPHRTDHRDDGVGGTARSGTSNGADGPHVTWADAAQHGSNATGSGSGNGSGAGNGTGGGSGAADGALGELARSLVQLARQYDNSANGGNATLAPPAAVSSSGHDGRGASGSNATSSAADSDGDLSGLAVHGRQVSGGGSSGGSGGGGSGRGSAGSYSGRPLRRGVATHDRIQEARRDVEQKRRAWMHPPSS